MTSVRISDENRNKLNELKTELSAKNIDEVITHLLEVKQTFNKSRIVRVIDMTTEDCYHCAYAQSNEDGIHCYRETRTKVKGTDTCEHYKSINGGEWID